MPTTVTAASQVGFATGLGRHGDRVALIEDAAGQTPTRTITYAELAAAVAREVHALGPERRLVMVSLERNIEAVTTYLAVLAGGHVALLAPDGDVEVSTALQSRYAPDVVASTIDGRWTVRDCHPGSAHDLHPELAALLSTSGSTGSPKLVRLSAQNLQANAESIAEALTISPDDRAVTTLPLTYSYGLSVLHSHLAVGASLLLTERSVVEASIWDAVARHRVTTFPGVPYTFDLLDRIGFARQQLPYLRHVTLAGGRLAPDRVRHYAELGRSKGYQLHVMYGQTEATARIATLAPHEVLDRPDAIGRPIPGGAIELVPHGDEPDVGEIVYRGPNVMLGYAESRADLARGRDIDSLHTGDLAARDADGVYRIVGRRARHAKVFGLRIDLDHTEQVLSEAGISACVVSDDTGLCVVAEGRIDLAHLVDRTARATGLPAHVIRARVVETLPRLPSGKLDRATASNACVPVVPDLTSATANNPAATTTAAPEAPIQRVQQHQTTAATLTALYATLLGRPDATADDSFVALGGDSLSYVEVSVRLESLLGDLPADWHTRTPRELAASAVGAGDHRWTARLETGVVLRATAMIAIVGTHIGLFSMLGGAHVLLGLAGFSMARFLLDGHHTGAPAPRVLRGAARIAVPSVLWISLVALVSSQYSWANGLLLGTVLGPASWGPAWHFWFVEALVLYLLIAAALLSVPAVRRAEQSYPFAVAGMLVAVGLVIRFGLMPGLTDPRPSPAPAIYFFWFFAIGWWAARASTRWQRLLVSAVILLAVPGFWDAPMREAAVALGLLVLLWFPTLRVPRVSVAVITRIAAASLAIYLTHWLVFPPLAELPLLALVTSLTVGVVGYELARLAMKVAKSRSFWSAYADAYAANARSARSLLPR